MNQFTIEQWLGALISIKVTHEEGHETWAKPRHDPHELTKVRANQTARQRQNLNPHFPLNRGTY